MQALAATGTAQARIRVLPSRVVVYLLLAGCLFAELGYRQVWHKLTAGLGSCRWPVRAIMRCGRPAHGWALRRCGGCSTCCAARPRRSRPGRSRWHGLLVCAIDGTTMTVPDSARNLAVYSKQAGNHGGSGYPLLRLVALVACGTRTVIDAVFGPFSCGEQDSPAGWRAACTRA